MLNLAQTLVTLGHPPPLVVVVNQPDVVAAIKAISPTTFVLYRVRGAGNEPMPYDEAGNWVNGADWLNYWFPGDIGADAYQCENEVFSSALVKRWRKFWLEGLAEAKRRHIKMTVGNFSVASYSEADVIALKDVFDLANELGCPVVDHAYLIHGVEPKAEPENVLRFKWITDRHPGIPIIVGEFAKFPAYPGVANWLHLVRAYDALLGDMNALAACYTLTTLAGGWQGFDYGDALEPMVAYWST